MREVEEGKGTEANMCSVVEISKDLPQSSYHAANESILGKRTRNDYIPRNSINSLLNTNEEENFAETFAKKAMTFAQPVEGKNIYNFEERRSTQESRITGWSEIITTTPLDAPAQAQIDSTNLSSIAFTPFLLPSPNMYYNPLNPPRHQSSTQMYPPQLSAESTFPSPSRLFGDKHSTKEKMEMKITNTQAQQPLMNFPLSDSPNKLLKVSSPEKPMKIDLPTKPGIPLQTTDSATTTNRFILVEQPNDIQRKSYKKENRCLLPNPLIICLRDMTEEEAKNPVVITDGTVSLKLVNNDGTELPPNKQNALESIEGGLTHSLGEDNTSCFSVKVLQTSEGNQFRLIFTVNYRINGGEKVEEQIISRPFAVYSNKHNRNSRKKREEKS